MNPLQRHQSKAARAKWAKIDKAKRSQIMRDVVKARWAKAKQAKPQ